MLGVPKQRNPKGIGLFVSALVNLWKVTQNEEYLNEAQKLALWLKDNYSKDYSGYAWGYNFPWQSRSDFKEKYLPTIVATSFVANSFLDLYEVTNDDRYFNIAASSAQFIINDLYRYEEDDSICFSYGPKDKNRVYNATALGAAFLARVYKYSNEKTLLDIANKAMKFVVKRQNPDGSWYYGDTPYQKWIDNFHTVYNLLSLKKFMEYTENWEYKAAYQKGVNFYVDNFFLEDGTPKYYHNKIYPIDTHAAACSIIGLLEFGKKELAQKVLKWTIENMWDEKRNYFYYRKYRFFTNKIPYMRWVQAWMFYALTKYLVVNYESLD